MIHVKAHQYDAANLTMEIYVSGCDRDCPGCHNPETHEYFQGKTWRRWLRDNRNKLGPLTTQHIWVMGGDIIRQDIIDYRELMGDLKRLGIPLWLWTGAESLDAIPKEYDIKKYFTYVKTGRYDREQAEPQEYNVPDYQAGSVKLATKNQKLYKLHSNGEYELCKLING